MSTSLLVSLLAAQVVGISLFFTDAYPDTLTPLLQMALFAALAAAIIFFCMDLMRTTFQRVRARKSRSY